MKAKYILPFSLLLWSCGDDDSGPSGLSGSIESAQAYDLGDNNDSEDIFVNLVLRKNNGLTELRGFIVPGEDQEMVSVETATGLNPDQYVVIPVDSDSLGFRFDADILDINGGVVTDGKSYAVMFLNIRNDRQVLSPIRAAVSMTDEPYLTGNYRGTWNDNLYTDFKISTQLKFDNDTLSGPFYYTDNYNACCGGTNDGEITVALDNMALSFTYRQQLEDFMGGRCNGTYSGDGRLRDSIVLEIDFTGNDCEGPHTNGKIVLVKSL